MANSNKPTLTERVTRLETKNEEIERDIKDIKKSLGDLTTINTTLIQQTDALKHLQEDVDEIKEQKQHDEDIRESNRNQIKTSTITTIISSVVSVVIIAVLACLVAFL